MSKENPIKISMEFTQKGHGCVSGIDLEVDVLKWNDLVKYISLMYTEAKRSLTYDDFDHTNFSDLEAM